MRDDLRREGRELREEYRSESLAVCLLVGLKATCVKSSNASIPGEARCAILISTQKATGVLRTFSLGKDLHSRIEDN